MRKVKTKDELVKENQELSAQSSRLSERMDYLRNRFTDVLCGRYQETGWTSSRREVLTWEEIFFKIGELNSDANYSIVLGEKIRLQEENQRLKNPEHKTGHAL